jgi:hypothetical protein
VSRIVSVHLVDDATPESSHTVNVTTNRPAVEKPWLALRPAPFAPSPKPHA